MQLTKKSIFTGKVHTMDLPNVEPSEYAKWTEMVKDERPFVQDYFKNATADEREFILTGCTPQEWDEMFSDE